MEIKEMARELNLAYSIGKKRFYLLYARHIEEFYQTTAEAAVFCFRFSLSGKQAISQIEKIFRQAMIDQGYVQPKDRYGQIFATWKRIGSFDPAALTEEKERCSVKWCEGTAVHYVDGKGSMKICHRHYAVVQQRKKRGFRSPLYQLELAGVPEIPAMNREFWKIIKNGVTPVQWAKMWLWAKGYNKEIPVDALQRAKQAIDNNVPERMRERQRISEINRQENQKVLSEINKIEI